MPNFRAGLRVLSLVAVIAATAAPAVAAPAGLSKINHLIVIYQENRSFDSLYGSFPGANGIANAGDTVKQVDKSGTPLSTLPQPINSNLKPAGPDPRFPASLPVSGSSSSPSARRCGVAAAGGLGSAETTDVVGNR